MSKWRLIAVAMAGVGLAAGATAQDAGLQRTNLGELRAHEFTGHRLTGKAMAQEQLAVARAATAAEAYQEQQPAPGTDGGLQVVNTGDLRRMVFEGHHLTKSGGEGAAPKILYAPSEADDPAYRAGLSAAAGGVATVDYFDARVATPSVATLLQYDAVHTWSNFPYADNAAFGNNLAQYNDQGGTVVLGVFCTYTSGNFLAGAIMNPSYCPVDSPLGTNHFTSSSYAGNGATCLYNGVTTLICGFRDVLVTQGSGVTDGTYVDAEICHAYRGTSAVGQGDVVYSNGTGAIQIAGTGQWAQAVANGCLCSLTGTKILYAPSEADDPAYRAAISAAAGGATVDYFDASVATPSVALLANYGCVHTWSNFDYADAVGFGNNLATFVDGGGDVVLGAFCTYTTGSFLAGQIMAPNYCPVVSPLGTNHFQNDTDAGPYFSCLTAGVATLTAFYRDVLITQGDGIIDSKYDTDKEIATAFRLNPGGGAGDVVYANGAGGAPVAGAGDWPLVIANATACDVGSQGPPSTCTVRPGTLGNPVDTACLNEPVVTEIWKVEVSITPAVGTTSITTLVTLGLGGPTGGGVVFGHELLILPPYFASQGFGTHDIKIPPVADMVGQPLSFQGARVELNPTTIVLTNALDVVVGIN
jgi:hypothetical protein